MRLVAAGITASTRRSLYESFAANLIFAVDPGVPPVQLLNTLGNGDHVVREQDGIRFEFNRSMGTNASALGGYGGTLHQTLIMSLS
jgi:hypothetical protein